MQYLLTLQVSIHCLLLLQSGSGWHLPRRLARGPQTAIVSRAERDGASGWLANQSDTSLEKVLSGSGHSMQSIDTPEDKMTYWRVYGADADGAGRRRK